MNNILSLFTFSFMQKALLAGLFIAPCAALLGVPLVLRRNSMIGDGLSHVGFGALSLAFTLGIAPLPVALIVVILSAFFILRLTESSSIQGDSAIALISSTSIAFGVIVTCLGKGMSTDIYDLMFGSILSVGNTDLYISLFLAILVLLFFFLNYRQIFSITFDETFARSSGVNVRFLTALLAFLAAITIVIGMRIMGSMLISSLLIFPALSSMQICRSFRGVTVTAAVQSVLAFIIGLLLSFAFSIPTGATITITNLVFFLLFSLIKKIKRIS